MGTMEPETPQPPKRSRHPKPLSCAECRRLKVKCDLKFPCAHCVKRGLGQICPEGEIGSSARKSKIMATTEALQSRIDALERALHSFDHNHPLLRHTPISQSQSDNPLRTPTSNYDNSLTHGGSAPEVQGAQMFGCLILGESPGVSRYYGSAGSLYLSRRTIPHFTGRQPPMTFIPIQPLDLPLSPSGATCSNVMFALSEICQAYLPPEDIGRALAGAYFNTFGVISMAIQPVAFEKRFFPYPYDLSLSSRPLPQKVAMVFLVFALGLLLDVSDSALSPNDLCTAAQKCLALDSTPSVTYVQCIYLYTTFLMNGANRLNQGDDCWPLLRAGAAIAEAIGLHREPNQWNLDEETAAERRYVFWSIHHYDLMQSICLGRGHSFSTDRVDTIIPAPSAEVPTPYFAKTYELTKITTKVNDLQTRISPTSYTEICEIDQQLWKFERSLPYILSASAESVLTVYQTDSPNRADAVRRNMIHLYLNEARVALHRPWFVKALRDRSSTDPIEDIYKNSVIVCFEACRAIIQHVSQMLAIHGATFQRRWHFNFHLFSACTCLAAFGIRAPSSTLARMAISELEKGISVFRLAQQDKLKILERLRDVAYRAVCGQEDEPRDYDKGEILELIGATTVLRNPSPEAERSRGESPFNFPQSYSSAPQSRPIATGSGSENISPITDSGQPTWPNYSTVAGGQSSVPPRYSTSTAFDAMPLPSMQQTLIEHEQRPESGSNAQYGLGDGDFGIYAGMGEPSTDLQPEFDMMAFLTEIGLN